MTTSALQALQAPVLLRLQHLPHQRHVVVADHADEQDRQIAGDGVRPQAGLAELVRGDRLGAGAAASRRCRARATPAARTARASSAEMPRWRRPLWACVNASANVRGAALGSRYFRASASAVSRSEAMPVAKQSRTVRARQQPDPLAQADDRIEHDAGRARQRAAVERHRIGGARGRGRGIARDRFPIRPAPAAGPRG